MCATSARTSFGNLPDTSCAPSSLMSVSIRSQPCRASESAMPSPIRLAAPVINTVGIPPSLMQSNTAGHIEAGARDIARTLGHQKPYRLTHIGGAAEPPQRRTPAATRIPRLFLTLHAFHLLPGLPARFGSARRNAVRPNALRSRLLRYRLGQRDDSGLGRGVDRGMKLPQMRRAAAQAGTRGQVDGKTSR